MLILKAEEVDYCQIRYPRMERESGLPGLAYRGRLFRKGESYNSNQMKEAIAQVRSTLDDPFQPFVLLVKGETELTLWYLERRVQRVQTTTQQLSQQEARQLCKVG